MLFNIGDFDSDTVASYLANRNICVRAGYHCSPLAHKAIGTDDRGAVRVSIGYNNTLAEAEYLISVIEDFLKDNNL